LATFELHIALLENPAPNSFTTDGMDNFCDFMSARKSINPMNSARTICDVNSWCLHSRNPETPNPHTETTFTFYEFYMGPRCDDDDAKDDDGIFTWEFYEQQIALQITR